MSTYGFELTVAGNILNQLQKVNSAIDSMSSKMEAASGKVKRSMDSMGNDIGKVGRLIVEAFAIDRIYEFGKEILTLTAEFEGFQNVIKYSSINSIDAGDNLEYIESAVRRLHLPIKEAMESFSEMQAGFYGTGIEGDRLRKVFEGVSTAATVLHLSAYKFSNVTFALKEIGELGTLQSRQMRMLAFALPGAMELAAKAMHESTQKLHQDMKHGLINSGVFLTRFADQLEEHFKKGLSNAGNSLISRMNDAKNAFITKMLDMGEKLRPFLVTVLGDIVSVFNSAPIRAFIDHIGELIKILVKIIPMWIIYKTTMLSISAATKAYTWTQMMLAGAMGETTVVIGGATVAVEGFEAALLSTGVGVFAVGLGYIIEKLVEMNRNFDDSIEKITHLKEVSDGYGDMQKTYERIKGAFENRNDPNMTTDEKGMILNDANSQIPSVLKKINEETVPAIKMAADSLKSLVHNYNLSDHSQEIQQFLFDKTRNAIQSQIDSLNSVKINESKILDATKGIVKSMANEGIKPYKPVGLDNEGGTTEGAMKLSRLAGAQGGLGEAKVINIHIQNVQQNNGVKGKELEAHAENAVGLIIRGLNNVAYQESRTM